ncbi:hypothetical protein S7711_05495 [Stachybotrys chartarum IBT 7711]|uniref:Uncharacterized protein n=1 Tax=Stachybotrys chartarum (strain CBS 109288 / IBT 7711) TaxID=1280523 RepID=A0A084AS03_STACB|nr:hypothetical protein S7711_05495 [Stachybotrys chartarum IBT 7711]
MTQMRLSLPFSVRHTHTKRAWAPEEPSNMPGKGRGRTAPRPRQGKQPKQARQTRQTKASGPVRQPTTLGELDTTPTSRHSQTTSPVPGIAALSKTMPLQSVPESHTVDKSHVKSRSNQDKVGDLVAAPQNKSPPARDTLFAWSETGSQTRRSTPLDGGETPANLWEFGDIEEDFIDSVVFPTFSSPGSGTDRLPDTLPLSAEAAPATQSQQPSESIKHVDLSETASTTRRSSPFRLEDTLKDIWDFKDMSSRPLDPSVPVDEGGVQDKMSISTTESPVHLPMDEIYDATPPKKNCPVNIGLSVSSTAMNRLVRQVACAKDILMSEISLPTDILPDGKDIFPFHDASLDSESEEMVPSPPNTTLRRSLPSTTVGRPSNHDSGATKTAEKRTTRSSRDDQKGNKRKQRAKTPLQFNESTHEIVEAHPAKKRAAPRRQPILTALKNSTQQPSPATKATRKEPAKKPAPPKRSGRQRKKPEVETCESPTTSEDYSSPHVSVNRTKGAQNCAVSAKPNTPPTELIKKPTLSAGNAKGYAEEPIVVSTDEEDWHNASDSPIYSGKTNNKPVPAACNTSTPKDSSKAVAKHLRVSTFMPGWPEDEPLQINVVHHTDSNSLESTRPSALQTGTVTSHQISKVVTPPRLSQSFEESSDDRVPRGPPQDLVPSVPTVDDLNPISKRVSLTLTDVPDGEGHSSNHFPKLQSQGSRKDMRQESSVSQNGGRFNISEKGSPVFSKSGDAHARLSNTTTGQDRWLPTASQTHEGSRKYQRGLSGGRISRFPAIPNPMIETPSRGSPITGVPRSVVHREAAATAPAVDKFEEICRPRHPEPPGFHLSGWDQSARSHVLADLQRIVQEQQQPKEAIAFQNEMEINMPVEDGSMSMLSRQMHHIMDELLTRLQAKEAAIDEVAAAYATNLGTCVGRIQRRFDKEIKVLGRSSQEDTAMFGELLSSARHMMNETSLERRRFLARFERIYSQDLQTLDRKTERLQSHLRQIEDGQSKIWGKGSASSFHPDRGHTDEDTVDDLLYVENFGATGEKLAVYSP